MKGFAALKGVDISVRMCIEFMFSVCMLHVLAGFNLSDYRTPAILNYFHCSLFYYKSCAILLKDQLCALFKVYRVSQ